MHLSRVLRRHEDKFDFRIVNWGKENGGTLFFHNLLTIVPNSALLSEFDLAHCHLNQAHRAKIIQFFSIGTVT